MSINEILNAPIKCRFGIFIVFASQRLKYTTKKKKPITSVLYCRSDVQIIYLENNLLALDERVDIA